MRSDSIGPKPASVGEILDVNTGGQFSSLCLEVKGTITAGSISIKGSLQGPNPVQMSTEDVSTGTILTDGKITEAGLYRVASAAIIHVFVIASGDFAQDADDPVSVYVTYSESLPPVGVVA